MKKTIVCVQCACPECRWHTFTAAMQFDCRYPWSLLLFSTIYRCFIGKLFSTCLHPFFGVFFSTVLSEAALCFCAHLVQMNLQVEENGTTGFTASWHQGPCHAACACTEYRTCIPHHSCFTAQTMIFLRLVQNIILVT